MVAIEYFTKWIEVEPLTTITTEKIAKFIWKSIVCRFGVPKELLSENGTQFASRKVKLTCEDLGIHQVFSSVEHPQSNGQAEAANKIILNGLKKKLRAAKVEWVDRLPEVIWAYHTTVQTTTKETPFGLVYGCDAMLPIEVELLSSRVEEFSEKESKEGRCFQLDTIE